MDLNVRIIKNIKTFFLSKSSSWIAYCDNKIIVYIVRDLYTYNIYILEKNNI